MHIAALNILFRVLYWSTDDGRTYRMCFSHVFIPEHREYSGHLANGTDLVADDLLAGRSCGTWRGQRSDTIIQTVTHVLWRSHPDCTVSNSKVFILKRAERVFWTISSIQKCVRRTQCKHLLLLKPRGQIIWNGLNPDTHHNN